MFTFCAFIYVDAAALRAVLFMDNSIQFNSMGDFDILSLSAAHSISNEMKSTQPYIAIYAAAFPSIHTYTNTRPFRWITFSMWIFFFLLFFFRPFNKKKKKEKKWRRFFYSLVFFLILYSWIFHFHVAAKAKTKKKFPYQNIKTFSNITNVSSFFSLFSPNDFLISKRKLNQLNKIWFNNKFNTLFFLSPPNINVRLEFRSISVRR